MPRRDRDNAPSWMQLWQMPTLVAGVVLLMLGMYLAIPRAEPHDFPGALAGVEAWLDASKPDEALEALRAVEPHLDEATDADRARFHALFGDQVFLKQWVEGWDRPENHRLVLRYYEQAKQGGYEFTSRQLRRWAQTLIALGREQDALAFIEEVDLGDSGTRHALIRRMIEIRMAGRSVRPNPEAVAPLLERYRRELRTDGDRQVRRSGTIWAAALEAQLLLDAHAPDRALDELMVRYQRLNAEGGDDDLAPLMIALGKAHLQIGNFDAAERHFLHAMEKLPPSEALNALALVGLAEVEQAGRRDNRTALGFFSQAVRDYPDTEAYIRALIGQADCKAKLGSHPEAIDDFALAIDRLLVTTHATDPRRELATNIIRSLYAWNFDREDFELALDYLTLVRPLYRGEADLPAQLLIDFAVTHERVAEQRRAAAGIPVEERPFDDGASTWTSAEPSAQDVSPAARALANRQAAEHFAAAGDYYLAHAQRVTVINDEQYGMSLWKAAQCYDAAQLWVRSVQVYLTYITTRPTDPHYLQAIRRLGMARLASGQYMEAAERFEELIENHGRTLEAYASLVPLAQCYVRLDRVDDAIRVLEHVVNEHDSITPASMEYRNALIELGRVYHQRQDYENAIVRLTEAVDRYGDGPRGPTLRFLLADAYRQSSEQIVRLLLTEVLPESREAALRAQRVSRLESALQLFGTVVDEMEQQDREGLAPVERLYHRNAYFYRADCAYDLGRYEQAIGLYDEAARRWERDPASLMALVQIVNAYCELGRIQEAQIANERARWQLKNIPDSAFEDDTLPMNRKHWQDWLRWTNELRLFEAAATAGTSNG